MPKIEPLLITSKRKTQKRINCVSVAFPLRLKNAIEVVSEGGANALLDTLAQLGKVTEKAPELLQKANLEKRARSKYISNRMATALVDTNSTLRQSYWNTWHCNEGLEQDGKTITGRYCNNRWCLTCNRIRTAKLIKGYTQPLKDLPNKQFVTLTIPNVGEAYLKTALEDMLFTFQKIKGMMKKRKTPIIGIRKTECTYNVQADNYHPHFHLIVSGEDIASEIVKEWLKRYPEANSIGQDSRPADDTAVHELFKYFTKIATYSKVDKTRKIHIHALDVIFRAMKGKRVFQPMGITKVKVSEDVEEIQAQEYDIEPDSGKWVWEDEFHDWVNVDTGEMLTGFRPSDGVIDLLNNIVFEKPPD